MVIVINEAEALHMTQLTLSNMRYRFDLFLDEYREILSPHK
jgi:hypothetical protein